MKLPRPFRFLLLLLAGMTVVYAAEPRPMLDAEQVKTRLAGYQSRLQLTPEQQQQLKPILQEEIAWLRDWRSRLEATPSRRDRRKLLHEAREHQEESEKKIEPLLTAAQRKTWQEIRKERRAEMKAAYKNRPAAP